MNVDVYRMNGYQVSFDDIANAIRAENLSVPGGTIDDGEKSFAIRVPGEFKQVKPLENIVVKGNRSTSGTSRRWTILSKTGRPTRG